MDIKDFILIGGGVLIAMVIGHGFWIAYRAKREPLRLDIVPDLIPGHQDEMQRLRGELPNGGARVINKRKVSPEQESFDLEVPPVLMEPAELMPTAPEPASAETSARRPLERAEGIKMRQAPARRSAPVARVADVSLRDEISDEISDDIRDEIRGRIRDEISGAIDDPGESQAAMSLDEGGQNSRAPATRAEIETEIPTGEERAPSVAESTTSRSQRDNLRHRVAQEVRSRDAQTRRATAAANTVQTSEDTEPAAERVRVEELLVINVLARKGERFDGEGIVETLRKQGLRYGDMNIFHRVDPMTKAKMYSVANLVEPGTFDLSDLQSMHSPGMSFFLQLPGPEEPMVAFADMLEAARNVALDLGGEMRDEQLSKLTGQAAEHMRQRIADFTRRRLSKRA